MNKTMFLTHLKQYIERTEGVTATSLALKAGMANTTIRNWFDGKASPSMTSAEKVLAVLGMSYEEFMHQQNGAEDPEILRLWRQLDQAERDFLLRSAKGLISQRREED